jgi:hypothetical protein
VRDGFARNSAVTRILENSRPRLLAFATRSRRRRASCAAISIRRGSPCSQRASRTPGSDRARSQWLWDRL